MKRRRLPLSSARPRPSHRPRAPAARRAAGRRPTLASRRRSRICRSCRSRSWPSSPVRSASKRDEPISRRRPRSTSSPASDIARSPATSLPEALRLRPTSRSSSSTPAQYAISARGFNGYETLEQAARPDRRPQRLHAAPFRRVLGAAPAAARGHRADRGDQRARRDALRPQRGQRRDQHRHPRRARHDRRAGPRHRRHARADARRALRLRARRRRRGALLRQRLRPRRPARPASAPTSTTAFAAGRSASAPISAAARAASRCRATFSTTRSTPARRRRPRPQSARRAGPAISPSDQLAPASRPITTISGAASCSPPTRSKPFDVEAQYNARSGAHDIVAGGGVRTTRDEFTNNANGFHLDPQSRRLWIINAFVQDRFALTPELADRRASSSNARRSAASSCCPTCASPGSPTGRTCSGRRCRGRCARRRGSTASSSSCRCSPQATDFDCEKLIAFEAGYRGQPGDDDLALGLALLQSLRRHPHHRVHRQPAAGPAAQQPRRATPTASRRGATGRRCPGGG